MNQVVIECRETLKKKWIEVFTNPLNFPTRESALAALRGDPRFPDKRQDFADLTAPDALAARLDAVLAEWTGGQDPLEFGAGRWLERVQGKPVWNAAADHCFRIADARGAPLKSPRKQIELARALVRLSLDLQPADFRTLRALVEAHIRRAS